MAIAYLKDVRPRVLRNRAHPNAGCSTSPKYSGPISKGFGWKMMGFADQHASTPPFGDYDRETQASLP